MPVTLFLVRHECRNPLDRTFDSPLLAHGRQRAAQLAHALPDNINFCYTSPFRRCLETMDPFMCRATASSPRARVEYALYERIAAETEEDRRSGQVPFDPHNYVHDVPHDSPHRVWLDDAYESWLPPHAVT